MAQRPFIVMDRFAIRQFDNENKNTSKIRYDPQEFARVVNQMYEERKQAGEEPLVDGYAPFCKHIFVPNFVNARASYTKITDENRHLLKSDYIARTDKELPVLIRWFPSESMEAPIATHLDVILYSRAQIIEENKAMGQEPEMTMRDGELVPEDAPWGIISIKPQMEDYETPMSPITIMRNCLISEGGSGVALDRQQYLRSVEFWKDHAMISTHNS
eukprot:TRINITY_DN6652_c0_g1_i1.p1 TRINITY_DN6652_c0_g1~~TRINITY_DN6652_c0_g1_i1.p1  ORF type:complete len:238 (+),score=87.42 TRINITY_DN6652_c0_g1_i1:68-715(+)